LFKKNVILMVEDDSSGGKAVLYRVSGRAQFAFGSDWAWGLGAVQARDS